MSHLNPPADPDAPAIKVTTSAKEMQRILGRRGHREKLIIQGRGFNLLTTAFRDKLKNRTA